MRVSRTAAAAAAARSAVQQRVWRLWRKGGRPVCSWHAHQHVSGAAGVLLLRATGRVWQSRQGGRRGGGHGWPVGLLSSEPRCEAVMPKQALLEVAVRRPERRWHRWVGPPPELCRHVRQLLSRPAGGHGQSLSLGTMARVGNFAFLRCLVALACFACCRPLGGSIWYRVPPRPMWRNRLMDRLAVWNRGCSLAPRRRAALPSVLPSSHPLALHKREPLHPLCQLALPILFPANQRFCYVRVVFTSGCAHPRGCLLLRCVRGVVGRWIESSASAAALAECDVPGWPRRPWAMTRAF